jgi:hypothetical protein
MEATPNELELRQRASASLPPTLTAQRPHLTLYLDYRFNESIYVPGILVAESAHGPPGVALRLKVGGKDCGEMVSRNAGGMVYVHGTAMAEPTDDEEELTVCKVPETPPRDLHTVMLARGNVLIEVLVFAESGVSRDEALRLARSLVQSK